MIHDVVPRHKIWEPDGLPCTIHLHDVVAISSRHTKTGMQGAWAGYVEPSYEVAYGPDRTTLTLPLVSADSAGEAPSKTVEARRSAAMIR